jgi:hypothetical protein
VRIEATALEAPPPANFPRLKAVDICFSKYPLPATISAMVCHLGISITHSEQEPNLAKIYNNIRSFIAWLKVANNRSLDSLSVDFEVCEDGDIRWSTPCTCSFNDWKEWGRRLATRHTKDRREVSIVESLLMPLKQFPVVSNPTISDIKVLTTVCDLARAPRGWHRGDLGAEHMYILRTT